MPDPWAERVTGERRASAERGQPLCVKMQKLPGAVQPTFGIRLNRVILPIIL
jgi:hypothetical protein